VSLAADALPWWEIAARQYETRPRRYARPGDLALALDPDTVTSPVLELIDDALIDLMDGATHNALKVFMPPQEGKSQRVSRRFPTWALDNNPALRIGIVSYELDLARRWGLAIKRDIDAATCPRGLQCDDPVCAKVHIPLRRDRTAAGDWETPAGGGVYCVGIGGPLTGRPIDILIVDDPVKDRAAAESDKIRDSTWDWWESVALTRLAPGAKVALVQTRWHEDDLAGRIAARPSPLTWRTLRIPAIAEDGDPLGREPGEELPSVRGRAPGHFYNLRAGMSPYVFSGVYQQTPTAAEGNFFRRATFRYWRPAQPWPDGRERIDCEGQAVTLVDCWRFATVDVAASVKTSADFTVVSVWAVTVAGDLVLLDRARKQVAEHDHFSLVEPLRAAWGFDQVFIEQSFFSTTLTEDARTAGIPVAPLTADTDKVTRAIPAAGRLHAGRVWFPAVTSGCPCGNCPGGVWLDEWCDELASFPNGNHDDQVDTFSYAARVITAEWTPAPAPPRRGLHPYEQAIATATRSATGDGQTDLDIFNVPL
jgi:predicted phage terminase large subunit-like protein